MPIQVAKVREFKGHTQAVYTLCNAGESDSFYSAGADGMIVQWWLDKEDGELFAKLNHPVYSLLLHENNLLCGGNNGTLTIIDIQNKQTVKNIILNAFAIFDIAFYKHQFLLAQENGKLSVFDLNYNKTKVLGLSSKSLRKILPVKSTLLITGSEGIIWQLNEKFEIENNISSDIKSIFALGFQKEKKILLSGGRDAVLKLWHNLEAVKTINAHWYHINDIAFNQSQQYFTTCSMDKTIKIWDGSNFELLKVIDMEKYRAHQSSVNKILWIGINRFISCSDDRTIMCFEIIE